MSEYPHDTQCEAVDGVRCFCWISRADAEAIVARKEAAEDRARMAEHRLALAAEVGMPGSEADR